MKETHGVGETERGSQADHNEDCSLANDDLGLYVVCDGFGGAAAGEVASQLAVQAIASYIDLHDQTDGPRWKVSDELAARAIKCAFGAIYDEEEASPEFRGMRTTLTMLLARNNRAVVGHVGDSRIYLARHGTLSQLTVDHELTGVLFGVNGISSSEKIDTFSIRLRHGDLFFLCTDGLNPVMAEKAWVLSLLDSSSLPGIANHLLAREAELDGTTDATVILVRVEEEEESGGLLMHYITPQLDLFQSITA